MLETILTIWDTLRNAYEYVAKQEDSEYIIAMVVVSGIAAGLAANS